MKAELNQMIGWCHDEMASAQFLVDMQQPQEPVGATRARPLGRAMRCTEFPIATGYCSSDVSVTCTRTSI
jgi:hypothetical protein